MTPTKPTVGAEQQIAVETAPEAHKELDLAELKYKEQCIAEADDQDQRQVCELIDSTTPVEQQQERVDLLEGWVTDILKKLYDQGIPIQTIAADPSLFQQLVLQRNGKIKLDSNEQMAFEVITHLSEAPGPVSAHFRQKEVWNRMVDRADDISKGPRDFFNKCMKENKPLTLAVSFGLILGMGVLGYKKLIASNSTENKEGSSTGKNVAIGLAAVAAVACLFKGEDLKRCVKDWVKDQPLEGVDRRGGGLGSKAGLELADGKKLEKPDGSNQVFVGDSMLHGFQQLPHWLKGKRPDFIGADGMRTETTLKTFKEALKADSSRVRGKEVLIYTGGNSVGRSDSPPGKIVADMIEIAKLAKDAGAKEVRVCTRFPIDPRRKEEPLPPKGPKPEDRDYMHLGAEGYRKRQEANMALYEKLKADFNARKFPQGTQLIDLYAYFADANGEMPAAFGDQEDDKKKHDLLHPRRAYVAALNKIYASPSLT